MLAFLRGKILAKGNNYFIVEAGSVGYRVLVNTELYSQFKVGEEIELYLYHHLTDQGSLLLGVSNMEELEFFELLLGVSGIGPKTALNVLAAASLDDLKMAIASGEAGILNKVSGIGPKTAERIVLELKNKVGELATTSLAGQTLVNADEIEALVALGYSVREAREALRQVEADIKDSSKRIRAALRILSR